MHEMVYDELMKAILRIIHKLDLSSIKEGSTFGSEVNVYDMNYVATQSSFAAVSC